MLDPDDRRPQAVLDRRIQASGELSDSDDEDEDGRRDHASYRDVNTGTTFATRKLGTGIMTATGPTPTNGAGPSGNTTVIPSGATPMDVDQTSLSGDINGSGVVSMAEESVSTQPPAMDEELEVSSVRENDS